MQCLQASRGELSVLERQIARLNWQQQQLAAYSNLHGSGGGGGYDMDTLVLHPRSFQMVLDAGHGEDVDNMNGNAHGSSDSLSKGWPDHAGAQYPLAGAANGGQEEASINASNNGSKKRKADNSPKTKQENSSIVTEDSSNKRMKEENGGGGGATSETKQSSSRKEASGHASREDNQPPKTDYIHVRARRGQATDSHSLAERVRRERISERMKYLQELVPGCNKITGKAGMLDEIINYVQSLQRQVEFLSMKLAVVNPGMDLNLDSFFSREIYPICNSGSTVTTTSDQLDTSYLQFNTLQQGNACSGLDMVMNTPEFVLRRSTSTSAVGMPDPFLDSCFNVLGSAALDATFNNINSVDFQQGRGSSFPFNLLQGSLLSNNFKM